VVLGGSPQGRHGSRHGGQGRVPARSSVIAEMGEDAEDVDRQIAEDAARADSLGLVFDSDPRTTEKSGALQAAEFTTATGTGDGDGLTNTIPSR